MVGVVFSQEQPKPLPSVHPQLCNFLIHRCQGRLLEPQVRVELELNLGILAFSYGLSTLHTFRLVAGWQ